MKRSRDGWQNKFGLRCSHTYLFTTMGKNSKGWLTVERRKILLDHREEYDDAPEGQDRKQVLRKIKDALKERAQGLTAKAIEQCMSIHVSFCVKLTPNLPGHWWLVLSVSQWWWYTPRWRAQVHPTLEPEEGGGEAEEGRHKSHDPGTLWIERIYRAIFSHPLTSHQWLVTGRQEKISEDGKDFQ